VLISVNGDTGQVAMLSIPRDLYVFIPGWTMNRINLALHQNSIKHVLLTGEVLRPWTVPISGEAVQLLDRQAAEPVLRQLMDEEMLRQAASVDFWPKRGGYLLSRLRGQIFYAISPCP
jgi:hypothetical protein